MISRFSCRPDRTGMYCHARSRLDTLGAGLTFDGECNLGDILQALALDPRHPGRHCWAGCSARALVILDALSTPIDLNNCIKHIITRSHRPQRLHAKRALSSKVRWVTLTAPLQHFGHPYSTSAVWGFKARLQNTVFYKRKLHDCPVYSGIVR